MSASNRATCPQSCHTLSDLPPVCEFADLAAILSWRNQDDAACGESGSWLLISVGADGAPSPLCDKHAAMLRDRVPLDRFGVELVRA